MPAHGDFTVVTSPIVHTLCGDLVAVPSYTDGPVSFDDTDTQVTYTDGTKIFDYTSVDQNLIGETKDRIVYVEFANYPVASYPALTYPDVEVPNATQQGPINILDPCANRDASFNFAASSQDAVTGVKYTNVATTIVPFVITPDYCEPGIDYTCTDVVRSDAGSTTLSCSDITIDPATGDVTVPFTP